MLARSLQRWNMVTAEELSAEHEREWDAPAPKRAGRRLLTEIDRYLEFFEIARGYAVPKQPSNA